MSNSIYEFYIKILRDTPLYEKDFVTQNGRWVLEGQTFGVMCTLKGWYEIQFGSKRGWINKDNLELLKYKPEKRIMVAWDPIWNEEANKDRYDKYIRRKATEQGLDVISPTWFRRDGKASEPDTIRIIHKCDKEYVRLAHRSGYEVWGLIADFDAERNYTVYSNEELVEREIRDIVNLALEYDLDGINIDFEGFGSRCRDIYNRYVEKLSKELKKHNFVVSIDITKESDSDAWGKCYDRKEISRYVDYVAYMAYDEHGRLDVLPGSTGSLPWVEDGIIELLNMDIPAEKILLGVPFYTRDWRTQRVEAQRKSILVSSWENIGLYETLDSGSNKLEVKAGSVFEFLGEVGDWFIVIHEGKKYYVRKALGKVINPGEEVHTTIDVAPLFLTAIDTSKGIVKDDEESGQSKQTYVDEEGFRHVVWLEDEHSMEKRLKLVGKYNLPGAAAWALTQETPEIWGVVKRILKG